MPLLVGGVFTQVRDDTIVTAANSAFPKGQTWVRPLLVRVVVWKPLLVGQLADQARLAIRDIAVAVAAAPDDAIEPADRTLFWAYATPVIDEPFAHAAYDDSLDALLATLRSGLPSPALHGGLAGVGFTLSHVLDGGAEDILEVIDEALLDVLAIDRWDAAHDLADGLVGYGVYFAERLLNNPAARYPRDGLARVIGHLDHNAIATPEGTAWLTFAPQPHESCGALALDGVHDCGVAHGQPGVIALLARIMRWADDARAATLLDGATRWMIAQRANQPDGGARFPAIVPPAADAFARFARLGTNPGTPRSRAAWCYGDPGIAGALWTACPPLARQTAYETSLRDPATCGVHDTGLCHGAAGLAHLCNRFYQVTGDAVHAAAATTWFERTLAMRRLEGVAGFAAWRGVTCDGREQWSASYQLLDGAIGTALALLGAVAPTEPNWDRRLLCEAH